jgi:hypothetical protein
MKSGQEQSVLSTFYTLISSSASIWTSIVREAEKDVKRDRENYKKPDPNFIKNQGIDNIINFLESYLPQEIKNANNTDKPLLTANDKVLFKDLFIDLYEDLKKRC